MARAAIGGCGGSDGGDASGTSVSGANVAAALEQQLLDAGGEPISAECPNERLVEGDDVECRVTFADGTYKDVVASVEGIDGDGQLHVEVDVP